MPPLSLPIDWKDWAIRCAARHGYKVNKSCKVKWKNRLDHATTCKQDAGYLAQNITLTTTGGPTECLCGNPVMLKTNCNGLSSPSALEMYDGFEYTVIKGRFNDAFACISYIMVSHHSIVLKSSRNPFPFGVNWNPRFSWNKFQTFIVLSCLADVHWSRYYKTRNPSDRNYHPFP